MTNFPIFNIFTADIDIINIKTLITLPVPHTDNTCLISVFCTDSSIFVNESHSNNSNNSFSCTMILFIYTAFILLNFYSRALSPQTSNNPNYKIVTNAIKITYEYLSV